jgi:hypothetical protein
MVAYNPAGFHLLSSRPDVTRPAESLFENSTLFDWLASRDIGVMIMKPLAGGLLCDPKAFPPYDSLVPNGSRPLARDVLRHILTTHPAVTCVLPGTASIDEADENARAGHAPVDAEELPGPSVQMIAESLARSICCHCGYCDTICSQGLPVSWLLRDADISATRSMTFETPAGLHYFELHQSSSATCGTCPDITCSCPFGIDVPAAHPCPRAHAPPGRVGSPAGPRQADLPREPVRRSSLFARGPRTPPLRGDGCATTGRGK